MKIDPALDLNLTSGLVGAPAAETLAYCMCRFAAGTDRVFNGGCDCLRNGKPPCEIALVNARAVLADLKEKK